MALRALQGPTGGGAPVGGTGTTNTIPRWTGASTLGDSQLKDNGTLVGIGASLTSGNRLVIGGVASGTSFIKANEATFQIGNIFAGPVQILTSDTPQVTVTGTGFVGIGTASPVGRTDIAGTSVDQLAWGLLSVRSSDAQGADKGGSLSFGGLYDATNSTHWAQISGRKENGTSGQYGGYLAFATRTNGAGANTERARIDSAGNFGIGVTPISPLHVKGNATNTDGILTLTPNTGGRNHQIQSLQASSLFRIFDQSAGVSRLEIDINGNISATTTGGTFNASTTNAGIKLPATPGNADTQTLDCYQENTWTPTLSAAATWGGTAPTITSARYTRVGRTVTCSVILAATGGAAYSSTWGSTTISAPFASGEYSVVPCAREAPGGSNGIQQTSTVYLPTTASSTAAYWITWTYQV